MHETHPRWPAGDDAAEQLWRLWRQGQRPGVDAFLSQAGNLVADDTNRRTDVFVRDRATDTTFRTSLASNGAQAKNNSAFPEISADGRFVTFSSQAGNLVPHDTNNQSDVFVRKLPAQ